MKSDEKKIECNSRAISKWSKTEEIVALYVALDINIMLSSASTAAWQIYKILKKVFQILAW